MKPLVKALTWVTMAVVIALGLLCLDVRRVVTRASRVSIQSDAQAAEVLARFPFESGYFARVVDEVPKTDWQMLLHLFPRHSQLALIKKFAWLTPRQEASLVASHIPMLSPSGRQAIGLDRAAKNWLNISLESATSQHLDELAKHRRRGRPAVKPGKPATPTPNPGRPPQTAAAPR